MRADNDRPDVAFGLLGPLTLSVDGSPVTVGAAKMRILLVSLLLRRGEVLSVDLLVERLWGEHPPAGARNAVHTYVRRLRTSLGAARSVIVTSPPGYFIDVPGSAVDIDRFRAHVESARSAAAAGDTATEHRELVAALALWRGQPLADVPSESLYLEERPQLIEEWLQAVEQRVDVDLRLGRHAEVVAELRALTSEYPLRERLWHQLMLALYRSRRQAEALNAYREVGTLLRDELGVDPDSELTTLHQHILTGDMSLHAPDRPPPDERPPANQLPPEVADFVGRDELVKRVTSLLVAPDTVRTGLPLVILSGPPGVGKTELALHLAHRVRAQFPDGQLFVNMRGFSLDATVRPDEALGGFLRAMGVAADRIPPRLDEQVALFRSTVAERRVLLVLDNVGSVEQVRPLLPGTSTCAVIVTSRDSLFGLSAVNGAHRVPVEPVSGAEAEALLSRIIGADRVDAERTAIADLASACGFLPLALRIAASIVASAPWQTVAGHARELRSGDRLVALSIDGDDQASVRVAFDLSYRALEPDVARLFRLLSLAPGADFDRYTVAALADVDLATARRMLGRLITANLVQHHGQDRYKFHDLIRDYSASHMGRDVPNALSARRRLLDYYLYVANAASQLLYRDLSPLPKPAPPAALERPSWANPLDALSWLETEVMNLVAIIRDPVLQESGAPVWLLADSLIGYFIRQRQDTEWLTALRSALAAAERAGDRTAVAAMLRGLGRLHYRSNEFADAHACYLRSAELSRELGDRGGEGRDLIGLGTVAFEMQDYAEADRYQEAALPLLRDSGDREGVATALMVRGVTLMMLGDADRAVSAALASKAMADELGRRYVSHRATASLAMLRSWRGEFEQAVTEFEAVLADWIELGYVEGQAETLRNLAEVRLETGQPEAAIQLAGRSLTLAERTNTKWVVMGAHVTLAEAHLMLGDVETAYRVLTTAASLAAPGSGYWYPYAVLGLAACHRVLGNHEKAAELAREVLRNQRPRLRARAYIELALICVAAGDCRAAVEHAGHARDISARHGYRPDVERARRIVDDAHGALAESSKSTAPEQCGFGHLP